MATDPRERRMRTALAACPAGDRDQFALTTCYAAGQCQRDLCCPFRDDCRDLELQYRRDLLRELETLDG